MRWARSPPPSPSLPFIQLSIHKPLIRWGSRTGAAAVTLAPLPTEQGPGGASPRCTQAAAPRFSPLRTRPSSSRHCFCPEQTDAAPAGTGMRPRRRKSPAAPLGTVALGRCIPLRRGISLALPQSLVQTKTQIRGQSSEAGGVWRWGTPAPSATVIRNMCVVRAPRDPPGLAKRRENAAVAEARRPRTHLPPRAPAALTSISPSAGPAPAAHGAAGAAPPSGPPLLPLLLPPAPAAAALEGALSGGGGGGGSAADDMFRLRHPPRPRAGAARREAAWACLRGPGVRAARGARPRPGALTRSGSATDPSRPGRAALPASSAAGLGSAPPAFTSRRESRRRGWAGPAGSRRSRRAG